MEKKINGAKEKTVTFAFRTTEEIAEMIRDYAYNEGKSLREVMEDIITEKLKGAKIPKRRANIAFDDLKYYTVKEVTNLLQCSDRTIRRYVKDGTLEGKLIANKLYITEASIKKYLEGDTN